MEINMQEKITRAMKKTKVSQTEIAKNFGVTQGTFSQRMKTGKFTQEELLEIEGSAITIDAIGATETIMNTEPARHTAIPAGYGRGVLI